MLNIILFLSEALKQDKIDLVSQVSIPVFELSSLPYKIPEKSVHEVGEGGVLQSTVLYSSTEKAAYYHVLDIDPIYMCI